jgi:ketosteroid isomerase-like protein
MSDETRNRDLMLKVIAAFKEADLQPLFAALHPDVVWKAHAPKALFRFGGTYHGLTGRKEYTALLFSRYHFVRLAPRAVTAKGEHVWGLFEAEAKHIPTGSVVKSDLVFRWTVQDGRIREHHGFFDTAGVLMQQGELQTEAA